MSTNVGPAPVPGGPAAAARPVRVLVYSDERQLREHVIFAIGRHPDESLPPVEFTECATYPALLQRFDKGEVDVAVFDGETAPAGGMGMCRQVKDEIANCPPVVVLTGRRDDAWLATWSRADAAVPHPVDPAVLVRAVVELAKRRLAGRAGRA